MKEDLKNKVIGEIKEKGIKPKSKSSIRNKIIAEMVFFIFMAMASFALGAITLNTTEYFLRYKGAGFADFIILTMPLIIILSILTILITALYRSLGSGYKYSGLKIALVVVVAMALGSIVSSRVGIHHARFMDDPAYRFRRAPGPADADPIKAIISIKRDENDRSYELKLKDESILRLDNKSKCFPMRCDKLDVGDIVVEVRPGLANKSTETVDELFVHPLKNMGPPRGVGHR